MAEAVAHELGSAAETVAHEWGVGGKSGSPGIGAHELGSVAEVDSPRVGLFLPLSQTASKM